MKIHLRTGKPFRLTPPGLALGLGVALDVACALVFSQFSARREDP